MRPYQVYTDAKRMPLNLEDRRFLGAVGRLKIYVLVMAVAVLGLFLLTPSVQIQLVTSVVGIALCGVFWLTSRLLSLVTLLDLELTRAMLALKRSLPPDSTQPTSRPRGRTQASSRA